MIKISISKEQKERIEDYHWEWFKKNKLKNWINKINKSKKLQKIFFKSESKFKIWFDKKSSESTVNWFHKQDKSRFDVFKDFIIGNQMRLEELKRNIGEVNDVGVKTYFENQYRDFRELKRDWGGAKLIKLLNTSVCLYCNRNFIDTYKEKDDYKSNGQLDHFYPKEKYPYLALSLYNLIPSCPTCNHIKSNQDGDFIYPYDDNDGEFGKDAVFRTDFYTHKDIERIETGEKIENKHRFDITYLSGNSDNFKIELKIEDEKSTKGKKIKKSIETFKLDTIYSFHKDYIREIIKKAIIYNESRINELYMQYPELFKNREEVVQMVVSNYISNENLGKRPLAKLTKDICEELGLR
ncbi:HNH endonuclease [Wukongibacter baidiensis]